MHIYIDNPVYRWITIVLLTLWIISAFIRGYYESKMHK